MEHLSLRRCGIATIIWLAQFCRAQINVYPSDLDPSPVNLDETCIAAINATINCDPNIVPYASSDYYGSLANSTLQDTLCEGTCGSSLAAYRQNVLSVCGAGTEMQTGYPVTYTGDLVWSYYNLTCLTDTATGEYCTDYVNTVNSSIATDTAISDLDSSVLCSPCMLQLFQNRQSTAFSGYSMSSAVTWASIQAICGVSYPTEVQAPAATPTSVYGYAATAASYSCLSGNNYTVVSGDTCEAIAHANNVATGTLITINQLQPGCNDIDIGQSLCLPQTCTTYTIASGDTCVSIASAAGISVLNLLSWNPTINSACTNLLADYDVCVSIPGGAIWNGTTIAGVTPTATGLYATTTVAPAGPTASGTTPDCGKYYEVVTGNICQLVALNNSISVDLFEDINPSVDEGCDNLIPGLYYCVFPTADWNTTSSGENSTDTSTTVSAPAPTATGQSHSSESSPKVNMLTYQILMSGTTKTCYEWYVVQSGDSCYIIEQSTGVTMDQLLEWNPALDAACDNLLLGDAYCVSGPTTTTSSATATATVSAPAPTLSGKSGPSQGS